MTIAAILSTKGSEVATVPAGTPRARRGVAAGGKADRRLAGARRQRRSAASFPSATWSAALATMAPEVLDWPVDRVMSSPVVTVDTQTPILAALATMTQRRMRHLPVVEVGRDSGNRLDRRPGEAQNRADRGRGRGAAHLYPVGLTSTGKSRISKPFLNDDSLVPDFLKKAVDGPEAPSIYAPSQQRRRPSRTATVFVSLLVGYRHPEPNDRGQRRVGSLTLSV